MARTRLIRSTSVSHPDEKGLPLVLDPSRNLRWDWQHLYMSRNMLARHAAEGSWQLGSSSRDGGGGGGGLERSMLCAWPGETTGDRSGPDASDEGHKGLYLADCSNSSAATTMAAGCTSSRTADEVQGQNKQLPMFDASDSFFRKDHWIGMNNTRLALGALSHYLDRSRQPDFQGLRTCTSLAWPSRSFARPWNLLCTPLGCH